MEKGYLYVATRQEFVEEAKTSVASLRKVDPEAHVTMVVNWEIDDPAFDKIIKLENTFQDNWQEALAYRINAFKQTPYQKTFFIDTDTYFCENCTELFQLVTYFDLLITLAPTDLNTPVVDGEKIEGAYSYNCGVFVYKKSDRILDFLDKWLSSYQNKFDIYKSDQQAFTEALLYTDIQTFTLHNIYNLRTPRICAIMNKKVKIIHGRHDDYEDMEKRLNRLTRHRVWIPGKNKVIPHQKNPRLFKRMFKLYDKLPTSVKNAYRALKS